MARVFFYHYNKPLSSKSGKPVISLHYKKQCLFVDNVVVNVKSWGYINSSQPRFVVKGKAETVEVVDGVAYIN